MTARNRAARIPIAPTAFSRDLRSRSKRPRQTNEMHLKFIRTLPCLICGTRKTIQAAHIRSGSPGYGKRRTGIGEKSGDHWTLPICAEHHGGQHAGNEKEFWEHLGIDPFAIALALFAASGDDERAELIIREAQPFPARGDRSEQPNPQAKP
jgi:hypothetical protein